MNYVVFGEFALLFVFGWVLMMCKAARRREACWEDIELQEEEKQMRALEEWINIDPTRRCVKSINRTGAEWAVKLHIEARIGVIGFGVTAADAIRAALCAAEVRLGGTNQRAA